MPTCVESADWPALEQQLDQDGCAIVRSLRATKSVRCTPNRSLSVHTS